MKRSIGQEKNTLKLTKRSLNNASIEKKVMIVVEELKNIYQDYEFLREGIQIILNKILI